MRLIDINGNRNKIVDALIMTRRAGIAFLINYMDVSGFFTAPCSTDHHLACEGGLAQHSINVYHAMLKLNNSLPDTKSRQDVNTIKICALLHDLGKMGDFGKAGYVENLVKSKTKNKDTGDYDLVRSDAKPYKSNAELLYIPHEVKSIAIAERFIALTESEEHAILYHNGLYGELKYSFSGKEEPLDLLLHFADMWSCRVTEKEREDD